MDVQIEDNKNVFAIKNEISVKEESCFFEIKDNFEDADLVKVTDGIVVKSEPSNFEKNEEVNSHDELPVLLEAFMKYPYMMENQVKYLQTIKFSQLTLNEKIEIKARGRPTPILSIQQNSTSRNKEYTRQFNVSAYQKCDWLCGCDEAKALFCFPCLLLGGDSSWTKVGVTDLRHLPQKIMKHEKSAKHLNNMIDLLLLGKVNVPPQIDTAYKLSVAKHNDQVRKNRDVLFKIINCAKFYGKVNLPLREGHDDSTSSNNHGIFSGLLDFACELDSSLDAHLKTASVFKETCKTIQNELLEAMLEICKVKIKEEIINAEYLTVMCDEAMDMYDKTQMVVVLRYELQGKPIERFWGFFNPINMTEKALSNMLLKELQTLIGDCPSKLIAQTYDGAFVLSDVNNSVHTRIKEVYRNAHFIHSYTHQFDLILEKATSQNKNVRVFFNSLSGIPAFFSFSPQRKALFENICHHRNPRPSVTRWDFQNKTVNVVHEIKDTLIDCCSTLEASNSRETGFAAAGIKRILQDPEFEFWLEFFSKVMSHVDGIVSQLQSENIYAVKTNALLKYFNATVQKLTEESNEILLPPEKKRRKFNTERMAAANKVGNIILLQCRERFKFISHFEASKLFIVNNFPLYIKNFPSNELAEAVAAYPWLQKDKLRTELTVLYTRKDLYRSENIIDLLEFMNKHHLQSLFSNTVKLIKILITTPMATIEEGRCFSTLKKIKTFLRNTEVIDRVSAVAMISIENKLITEMKDFNEKVINQFATSMSEHTDFIFK